MVIIHKLVQHLLDERDDPINVAQQELNLAASGYFCLIMPRGGAHNAPPA